MTRRILLLIAAAAAVASAQPKPANVPLTTWVREDLFSGPMANDTVRFEAGMKKVETYLAEKPDDPTAVAFLAFGEMCRAVAALEAGGRAEFASGYEKSMKDFERANSLAKPNDQSVAAIMGGTFSLLSERLPEARRTEAYQAVRDNFTRLRAAQKPFFDQLPVHMRGEVIAGLAQASYKLGMDDDAKAYLAEIVAKLPGTPYASRAQKWIDNAESAGKSSLTCLTCHDPGRLKNRMAQTSGSN